MPSEEDEEPELELELEPASAAMIHGSVWEGKTTVRDLLALSDGQRVSMEISAGPWAIMRKLEPGKEPGPVPLIASGWLDAINMADVLSLVQTIKLDGELTCDFEECLKTVFFDRGTIVHASSTLDDDRLVELLLAQGRITRTEYTEMTQLASAGSRKLGRILVERGALTEHQLYEAVIEQVEHIVISLFGYAKGSFCFSAKPIEVENPIKLPRPMMFYILEGSRRRDELDESLTDVSDREAVFKQTGLRPETTAEGGAPGIERDVLALIDGTARVWQIVARSTWSETNTRLALARLLRAGIIEMGPKPEAAVRTVTLSVNPANIAKAVATVDRFNEFFRVVREAVTSERIGAGAFKDFLSSRPASLRGVFDGVEPLADGTIDAKKVVSNLISLHLPEGETATLLRAALEDAVEYCLWLVREQEGSATADEVGQKARELLRN